jgi:Family of unknown function (DUF6152)
MRARLVGWLAGSCLWGAAALPAFSHHAFVSVFDPEQPLELTGTVTKVEWMNPHAWIYIDVALDDGASQSWGFEMGSPNTLVRRGWSHDTLQAGQVVTVSGLRARDGTLRGAVVTVTLPSGERLFGAQDTSR